MDGDLNKEIGFFLSPSNQRDPGWITDQLGWSLPDEDFHLSTRSVFAFCMLSLVISSYLELHSILNNSSFTAFIRTETFGFSWLIL